MYDDKEVTKKLYSVARNQLVRVENAIVDGHGVAEDVGEIYTDFATGVWNFWYDGSKFICSFYPWSKVDELHGVQLCVPKRPKVKSKKVTSSRYRSTLLDR